MNKQARHFIIHCLLIFVFIAAGISPACKFISGQQSSFIEICTPLDIKIIPVPESNVPPGENRHKVVDQCLFCFATQFNKAIADNNVKPGIITFGAKETLVAFDHETLTSQSTDLFEARAPPYIS